MLTRKADKFHEVTRVNLIIAQLENDFLII